MAKTTASVPFDRQSILDRIGGDESLLDEIAELFLSEYPVLLGEIREAVAHGDARQLQHSAHSLKGAISHFGAEPATQAAYQLEMIGKRNELQEATEALINLERQLSELRPALESMLHG
jgi:HPt (histidine-containing phosphotransfer) domain-containing protein